MRTLPGLLLLGLVLACSAAPPPPGPPTPWRGLASAEESVRRGDADAAVRTLRDLVAHHPSAIEPRRLLGRLLLAEGSPDAAPVLAALGSHLDREDRMDLVEAYLIRGDTAAASRALRAYAADPGHPSARPYVLRARIDLLGGDSGAATAAYEQALAVDPDRPDALEGLLRLATDRGDDAARDEILVRLRRAHPGRPLPR